MWRGLCREDGFRFWCSLFFSSNPDILHLWAMCFHLVRIVIQHLMSCTAGDWMVLTLRLIDHGGRVLVALGAAVREGEAEGKTNVCLSEWCPGRDAERRELTGLLAPLLISGRGGAAGQTRPLVPTVWPAIDSLIWNHPQFKSDNNGQTQTATCCFICGVLARVFVCHSLLYDD